MQVGDEMRKLKYAVAAAVCCFLGSLRAENVDTTLAERASDGSEPPPAAVPLRVVHPREGMSFPALRGSFSYGWADPSGKLTINGKPVLIHPGGGWLAMVDYAPGLNTLRYSYEKAGATLDLDRVVSVGGGGGGPLTGIEAIKPDQDLGVMPGETVTVSFRGPPGGKASFHIPGVRGKFPMSEVNGSYRGFYIPEPGASLKGARIKITFDGKRKDFDKETPGRLTVLDPEAPWIVEVSTDIATLRAGPGFSVKDTAGYVMFPPMGVRLRVTGFRGDELRVRVTRDREVWIGRGEVDDLPRGTPIPQSVTYGVTVLPSGRHGLVRMAMSQKAPFEVTTSDDMRRIEVRFFGTYSNTDWIHLSQEVPWIRQARWSQETSDVFLLSVDTDKGWWGYDARYEGGSFVLEIRRPPPLPNPRYPLTGLTIAVDAGHSADNGSIGITGTLEKDLNRAIAECLKRKLELDRAQVVMIREGDAHVPLYDRPKLAWAAKADILVSVHNNALPEGEDPFEKNGFGVYYFHPHSLAFAEEVYRSYQERFLTGKNSVGARMRDDGLHWGNLALPRTTQMPAILTESAYMIFPPEEWWLRQPSFQCDCAEAMRVGLKRYARKARPQR
jgi:N-acetylmuramoyl-L-alanine amidase